MRTLLQPRRLIALAALAALLLLLAGPGRPLGGGEQPPAPPQSPAPTISASAACPQPTAAIERPPTFPAAFPLPPGTQIVAQESRSGERIILSTLVPGMDVKAVALFFERELPRAGFTITGGESEPGEAEANYQGNGYRGRWKVNSVPDCAELVTLQVLAGR